MWLASYCFQILNGIANLLSSISYYEFILKDYQENIKVTIICHKATFLFIIFFIIPRQPNDKQLLTLILYSFVNLYLLQNMAERKLAGPIKL